MPNAQHFGKLPTMTTPMRTRYSEVMAALDAVQDRGRPGRVLDLLARMLDLTDSEIAALSGISRATVNAKRSSKSPIRADDLWPLSDALGVPMEIFFDDPGSAARWLIDNSMGDFAWNVA